MRNSHSCPKCRSTETLRILGRPGRAGIDNIFLGATIFAGVVLVTRYVCASCGFSEEWVDERADLEKLRSKYNG